MWWLAIGEGSIPVGDGWLAHPEAARAAGMRFTKRRTEYLLRRLAAKRAVAAALARPVDPPSLRAIAALNRPGGAPYLLVDGHPADLHLSLTDRAGTAVALLGAGPMAAGTLGIDLELVEPRSSAFVADYLTPAERDGVAASGPVGTDSWNLAANLVWSAKESALKVLRVGLRADTRSVVVSWGDPARPDGWAPLGVRTRQGWTFPGWWRRDGQFVLTVVYREDAPPPVLLAGGDELATAVPTHSWLARPVADVGPGIGEGPTWPTRVD